MSAHCALQISLYCCVPVIYSERRTRQSTILYDCCSHTHMHHQHLILIEPLNTQSLASRSLISRPYRRATQDPQPFLDTPSRYSQPFKDSFNVRPTSHWLHLCVKSPSLATSPSHTTSSSHPKFSQSPEYFTVPSPAASSRIRTRHQKQYSTCRGIQLSNQIDIQHADRPSSMQMDR